MRCDDPCCEDPFCQEKADAVLDLYGDEGPPDQTPRGELFMRLDAQEEASHAG